MRIQLDAEPIDEATTDYVRWLHLSDFHFQSEERWDRRATLNALLRFAAELKEIQLAPDLVFVTGDIAASGQRREYEQAKTFFAELAKSLDLDPVRSFFLVPGNHDVNRKAINPGDHWILRNLSSECRIEEILRNPPTMKLIGDRLNEFYGFTARLLGSERAWQFDRPWKAEIREIRGVHVGILQLNSAWASGSVDSRRLLLGEAQIRDALDDISDTTVRIALVHHPITELIDFDRERIEIALRPPNGVHFLLRGHHHRTRAITHVEPDGGMAELAAGAAFTGGDRTRTSLLATADLTARITQVRFFRYSDEGNGSWIVDTKTYTEPPAGVWTFKLPTELKRAVEVTEEKFDAVAPADRDRLAARYRAAVTAVHSTVGFVGFAGRGDRPPVEVAELFVPLRLEPSAPDDPDITSTFDLLRRLLDRSDDGSADRYVVLGDPGSGKTMLCRYAVAVIAGEISLEGVHMNKNLLPLFLPIRDYVRYCEDSQDCSLLEYLTAQARNQLQVSFTVSSFFEEALEDSRAVLLVDGLDEVVSAIHREKIRDRIQAFCRLYPRVPSLVTSRIAGYEVVPLPRRGRVAFSHLKLKPFTDNDLDEFVTRWYTVREWKDPISRSRKIAELSSEFRTRPQVRELARRPMLATLMALVHSHHAYLPSERATLYEDCVKTLLETWPASRQRRFPEIDERLQRTYLEAIAWRMLETREEAAGQLTIGRDALVNSLVEIIRCREGAAAPEETRGIIDRWLIFLEEGTGLLVEQRPGIFAFVHRSLMEYLAAGGLETVVPEPLEVALADRYTITLWHEACLLAVGKKATDKLFLDRLFRYFTQIHSEREADSAKVWTFLLRCLREEAVFDDEQRAAIVRGAARHLLGTHTREWEECQALLFEICQFSRRHSAWAAEWTEEELRSAGGEDLQAIVAICHNRKALVTARLNERRDSGEAAATLLDYWPGAGVGAWAASAVQHRCGFQWARKHSAEELVVIRSLGGIRHRTDKLSSVFLLALSLSAQRFVSESALYMSSLPNPPVPRTRELPFAILAEPGSSLVGLKPSWPTKELVSTETSTLIANRFDCPYLAKEFARGFSGDIAIGLSRDFALLFDDDSRLPFSYSFSRVFAQYLCRDYALGFGSRFGADFIRYLTVDFGDYFSGKLLGDFIHDFVEWCCRDFAHCCFRDVPRLFPLDFALETARAFSLAFVSVNHVAVQRSFRPTRVSDTLGAFPGPLAPDSRVLVGDVLARQEAMGRTREEEGKAYVAATLVRHAAEAWVGMCTTVDRSAEERMAHVYRRVLNAWVLNVWPAVDLSLEAATSPEALALYLALGWTQATTTRQWPGTPRWIGLLGGGPPAHWLPRSQWHLCWLLHDPYDTDHREGLAEALREGLDDKHQPQIAAHLRELFPEQPTIGPNRR